MIVFQEFLSSWRDNAQEPLFLAGYPNLDFGVHIHKMGIIPIYHSTVVMIKKLEKLRKNFTGNMQIQGRTCRYQERRNGTYRSRGQGWPGILRTQHKPAWLTWTSVRRGSER